MAAKTRANADRLIRSSISIAGDKIMRRPAKPAASSVIA